MACYNKVGSLLRRSNPPCAWLHSYTSTLNAVRFMSTQIFVGGLPYRIDNNTLKDAFSSFGEIEYARVVADKETGESRGFGFVAFSSEASAAEAVSDMDGQEVDGRSIRVRLAETTPNSRNENRGASK